MGNNCIITGSTGYIGSHLLRYLLDKGWKIHIIADPKFGYANIENVLGQIDIFEYDGEIQSLIEYFKTINPEIVFHLAAAVISNYKPEHVSTLIQSNVQFGAEVLEAMKQSNTRLFIGTGSYWQNYDSEKYNPVDLYAASKEAFEKILKYYTEAENIRAITLRLFDVYGANDSRPKLWNIIKRIAGTDQQLDVSPGDQILDMVYVTDVCTAYEQAYYLLKDNGEIQNEVYGVYTNERMPLKNIIDLYKGIINKPLHVNYGGRPYKPREVMSPTKEIPLLPGWHPEISLEDGFRKLLANED